jgi:hypothetical protein
MQASKVEIDQYLKMIPGQPEAVIFTNNKHKGTAFLI